MAKAVVLSICIVLLIILSSTASDAGLLTNSEIFTAFLASLLTLNVLVYVMLKGIERPNKIMSAYIRITGARLGAIGSIELLAVVILPLSSYAAAVALKALSLADTTPWKTALAALTLTAFMNMLYRVGKLVEKPEVEN